MILRAVLSMKRTGSMIKMETVCARLLGSKLVLSLISMAVAEQCCFENTNKVKI